MPATRWRRVGEAAAHSPNAPSTCTQAGRARPGAGAPAQIAARSSQAPVVTLPAWVQTIVGASASPAARTPARAPASIAPSARAATTSTCRSPKPSSRKERSIVAWRSAPTTMRTGGAPIRPSRSTSHPTSASTWWRAAARPTVLAPWAPVTNPTVTPAGRPSNSASPRPATSLAAVPEGAVTALNTVWSQPTASRSATSEASVEPPTTKPKYRGPSLATRPGPALDVTNEVRAVARVRR